MLHVSVKSIGWLVGGPDIIVRAILDIITETGTLLMYCGWEDGPYTMEGWSREKKKAYYAECPPYDLRLSRAVRAWGVVAEILRRWPGTMRSSHPDSSFCANGFYARYLTENHPVYYGYGKDSPLEKLIQIGGKVLLLGAPFSSLTLLHHTEDRAVVMNKPVIRYAMPVKNEDGKTAWVDVEESDTNRGIAPGILEPAVYFNEILFAFVYSFCVCEQLVGNARTFLLEAPALNRFAIHWMETHLIR